MFHTFDYKSLNIRTFYSSRFLYTRAPDSSTFASSLCASLRFFSASESEPRSQTELPSAPAYGSSQASDLGMRDTPAHLRATPSVPPPARDPTAELWKSRARRKRSDQTAGAASARTRCIPGAPTWRAPERLSTCCSRVFRRAERRESRRAERRVFRRGAACLLARRRRVYRRVN